MSVHAFKYYTFPLFLSYSGMLIKSFPSACYLLLNLQRMLIRATVREKVKEMGWLCHFNQAVCLQTFLIHKMRIPEVFQMTARMLIKFMLWCFLNTFSKSQSVFNDNSSASSTALVTSWEQLNHFWRKKHLFQDRAPFSKIMITRSSRSSLKF